MKSLKRRAVLILLFLQGFVTYCAAQTPEESRAKDWLTLQKLSFTQASASWSLSKNDLKQIVTLQGTSPLVACINTNTTGCKAVQAPLPVTGLKLKGRRLNSEKVLLNWETVAEYNSKGFILERRSLYEPTKFDSVYFVASTGNEYTSSQYEHVDFNNSQGSSFYRIKQVDNDGNYAYSNTIKIDGIAGEFGVSVVPNPAKGSNLRFYFTTSSPNATVDFTVSNASGMQVVKKEKFSVSNGYYEIKDNQLPPGYYFITVYTQQQVYSKSFIIID